MTHKHWIISIIVAATLLFVTPAALAAQDESATVGWLFKEIAAARGLPAPTEAGAAEALRAAGIAVPSLDSSKQLTERDVVAIGQSLGISATTRNPDAPFNKSRGRAFLSAFHDEIGGAGDRQDPTDHGNGVGPGNGNGNGPPFDPFSKGKKKGHNRSESDPI